MSKPILCIDFDGVIHRYDTKWTDEVTISDRVTEGFFEWADKATVVFELVVYSSRSKNPDAILAMQRWLHEECRRWREAGGKQANEPLEFRFASEKPPAFLTIDDRAVRFEGDWRDPALAPDTLRAFKPWNKR